MNINYTKEDQKQKEVMLGDIFLRNDTGVFYILQHNTRSKLILSQYELRGLKGNNVWSSKESLRGFDIYLNNKEFTHFPQEEWELTLTRKQN